MNNFSTSAFSAPSVQNESSSDIFNSITEDTIKTLLTAIDSGLSHGLGISAPGKMCVEAAVCFALGLPHNDNPICVGEAVRSFKIRLNDSNWSSTKDRAQGMKKLAVAQLGSDILDQKEFAKKVYIKIKMDIFGLSSATATAAADATTAAYAVAAADDYAAYYAAYDDATADADAAYATAYAATATASDAAADASDAAEAADDYAAASDAYADAYADKILVKAADIALQILIDMKSPGCQWLYLCD